MPDYLNILLKLVNRIVFTSHHIYLVTFCANDDDESESFCLETENEYFDMNDIQKVFTNEQRCADIR